MPSAKYYVKLSLKSIYCNNKSAVYNTHIIISALGYFMNCVQTIFGFDFVVKFTKYIELTINYIEFLN